MDNTSPAIAKMEYKVCSVSDGPATFAKSLLSKITSSDKTPSLTNTHALPFPRLPLINSCELLVPHSSSDAQIYAFPILHLLAPAGGS